MVKNLFEIIWPIAVKLTCKRRFSINSSQILHFSSTLKKEIEIFKRKSILPLGKRAHEEFKSLVPKLNISF